MPRRKSDPQVMDAIDEVRAAAAAAREGNHKHPNVGSREGTEPRAMVTMTVRTATLRTINELCQAEGLSRGRVVDEAV